MHSLRMSWKMSWTILFVLIVNFTVFQAVSNLTNTSKPFGVRRCVNLCERLGRCQSPPYTRRDYACSVISNSKSYLIKQYVCENITKCEDPNGIRKKKRSGTTVMKSMLKIHTVTTRASEYPEESISSTKHGYVTKTTPSGTLHPEESNSSMKDGYVTKNTPSGTLHQEKSISSMKNSYVTKTTTLVTLHPEESISSMKHGYVAKTTPSATLHQEESISSMKNGYVTKTRTSGTLPRSCEEVKHCNSSSKDGEYWLNMLNFDFYKTRIYCHNISSDTPEEFLSLHHENYGFYPSVSNSHGIPGRDSELIEGCKDRDGEVWFKKIKVDINTMAINRNNTVFANFTKAKLKYGEANDCYTAYKVNWFRYEPKGLFVIDLRNTGWKIHPNQTWVENGYWSVLKIDLKTPSVIKLHCGGSPGGCRPNGPLLLTPNHKDTVDHLDRTMTVFC